MTEFALKKKKVLPTPDRLIKPLKPKLKLRCLEEINEEISNKRKEVEKLEPEVQLSNKTVIESNSSPEELEEHYELVAKLSNLQAEIRKLSVELRDHPSRQGQTNGAGGPRKKLINPRWKS